MAFIESGKSFDKKAHSEKMKKRMDNMDTVQYPLRIPSALYKKIKVKTAQDGVTLRAVMLELLEKYMNK